MPSAPSFALHAKHASRKCRALRPMRCLQKRFQQKMPRAPFPAQFTKPLPKKSRALRPMCCLHKRFQQKLPSALRPMRRLQNRFQKNAERSALCAACTERFRIVAERAVTCAACKKGLSRIRWCICVSVCSLTHLSQGICFGWCMFCGVSLLVRKLGRLCVCVGQCIFDEAFIGARV